MDFSLTRILDTAKQGLRVSQAGTQVSGHNIANADTEGYTRQIVHQTNMYGLGSVMSGVYVEGIERPRDRLVDASYRRENSRFTDFDLRRDVLSQVEAVVADLDGGGVAGAMESFFNAWSDLATNPSGAAQRDLVQREGANLVDKLRTVASRIGDTQAYVVDKLNLDVSVVNRLSEDIAFVNKRIIAAQSVGRDVPDLMDQRDRLLDEMSEVLEIDVLQNSDGGVTVTAGNALLVDGDRSWQMQVNAPVAGPPPTPWSVSMVGMPGNVTVLSGRIRAELDLLNVEIGGLQARVDQFTNTLVTETNAIHSIAMDTAGTTGIDFFDPAGTTAASIALDPAILASSANVMSAYTTASGDGDAAMDLSRLRQVAQAGLGGNSLTDEFADISVQIGMMVEQSNATADAQETLTMGLANHRSSVSDVSVEEEMMNLTKYQHAYAAAAKVVSSAKEMMSTLLNMV